MCQLNKYNIKQILWGSYVAPTYKIKIKIHLIRYGLAIIIARLINLENVCVCVYLVYTETDRFSQVIQSGNQPFPCLTPAAHRAPSAPGLRDD